MIARLLCKLLGHSTPVRFERREALVLWVGHACPRCLVVLDASAGNRRARRAQRFGR